MLRAKPKSLVRAFLFSLGQKTPGLVRFPFLQSRIQTRWKEVESFSDIWQKRIAQMAEYIPSGARVVDLGCGKEWLKPLVNGRNYTGVDYTKRSESTIVCDFNKKQFPEGHYDVAFVSGCLEFVEDPDWFVEQITNACDRCILSYCSLDENSNLAVRRRSAWVNDLTISDLGNLFSRHSFEMSEKGKIETTGAINSILVFDRITKTTGAKLSQ